MGLIIFNKIKSFEIVTLHTSGMRFVCEHEIVMKDGKAEVSLYNVGFDNGQKERYLRERVICEEKTILKLLNDCRVISWNGFYGSHPKGVLDGMMFKFDATVNGDNTIHASGSENFPNHFRDFTDGLYNILHNKTAGETDEH